MLETKDFQQVRGYADALDCRSVLIDANRVYLIEHGASEPHWTPNRRDASARIIEQIGEHLPSELTTPRDEPYAPSHSP